MVASFERVDESGQRTTTTIQDYRKALKLIEQEDGGGDLGSDADQDADESTVHVDGLWMDWKISVRLALWHCISVISLFYVAKASRD